MGNAPREENRVPGLVAKSDADNTPVIIEADPVTKRLKVNATITGSASDGSIVDGVDTGIKATVFDYANANPLGVVLRDTNGDYVSVGGGTQYTEDAAAAANPVGTAVNLIRKDTPAGEVTTDGDNIAQRGTNYGAAYVTLLDTNGSAVSIGGGTQYDEDTASADAQKLTMAGVTRADTAASQVGTDGDRSTLIVDSSGRLHVNVGTSALPTGAATSAKQDTGNTSLASIDGKITAVNTGAVVVSSSALPSGAATSAKQDTMIGHIDGVEALLTTIDADTSNLSVVGGGTEATAQRVTIANDSTGVLSVDDNGSSLTVDNAALTELAAAINSNLVDVNIVSGAGSGGTAAADDADFTAGTTQGTPAMGVYESSPSNVTDGDLGTVGITVGRRLKTSSTIDAALPAGTNNIGDVDVLSSALPTGAATAALQTQPGVDIGDVTINNSTGAAAVNIQDGGNSITVDGTVTINAIPAGNNNIGDVDVASIAAGDNNIGNVDIVTLPVAFNTGTRSATTQRVTVATDDLVPVSIASVPSHAVTNAGTFATQENGAALTAMQLIDDTVFADDAAVTLGTSKGNIASGVAVQTDGTDPTAVSAEGDAAALRTDMQRNLIVNQTHPRFWHGSADYASAQTNASVKAAPGASLSLYITDLQVSNGATAGNITLLDGSGGTVLYEVYPAINGGAVLTLRSPIKLTANTALCITSTTVTTHSIFVSGYIGP